MSCGRFKARLRRFILEEIEGKDLVDTKASAERISSREKRCDCTPGQLGKILLQYDYVRLGTGLYAKRGSKEHLGLTI